MTGASQDPVARDTEELMDLVGAFMTPCWIERPGRMALAAVDLEPHVDHAVGPVLLGFAGQSLDGRLTVRFCT